jgi:single-stranded-DNA-specific exonuclease
MSELTTEHNAQPTPSQSNTKLHPVIQRLFDKRDYSTEDIIEFLSWDLKELPNLTNLQDIEVATERIIEAINNNEKVGIYGDYDVDGTTSCALFYHFFKLINIEVATIQPSRFIEGYGIHPPSIDKAISQGIELLITVDCGITNVEAAQYSKEKGLDLIITDHHKDAREILPPAYAVVNPSRRDEPEDGPLRPMAGVGVAFAICVAVRKELARQGREMPTLYPLLQFVAVGTICDLAPLTPMNLKMVRHGLKQLVTTQYLGLRTFIPPEERDQKFIPSEKLSFNIGPMINSKGRLDHPEKALELLITDDADKAFECYQHLEISNKERKFIQANVFKEAKDQVLSSIGASEHLISMVYQEDWHEGVIGIVASKLVENFKVPAIVFSDSEEKGIIKASARSVESLNIFDLLHECRDFFVKFGGHKAAAGLSMPKENLRPFIKKMNQLLENIPAIERTRQDYYDLEISPHEINPQLVKELSLLEPFGMGNSKPLFRMKNFKITSFDLLKDIHVRWNLTSTEKPYINLRGISFNYVGKWEHLHPEDLFNMQRDQQEELMAYFTLGINRFKGNEYLQLQVERIVPLTI